MLFRSNKHKTSTIDNVFNLHDVNSSNKKGLAVTRTSFFSNEILRNIPFVDKNKIARPKTTSKILNIKSKIRPKQNNRVKTNFIPKHKNRPNRNNIIKVRLLGALYKQKNNKFSGTLSINDLLRKEATEKGYANTERIQIISQAAKILRTDYKRFDEQGLR